MSRLINNKLKEAVPWWAKIGAKIVLARLPISYAFWKRLGLFEHGDMNQSQWAVETFIGHARTAGVLDGDGSVPHFKSPGPGYAVLELGPGDSLFSAVIATSLGASKNWLVDAGSFATTGISGYADLVEYLQKQGFQVPMAEAQTLAELLEGCHAQYLTEGVRSLEQLKSNSIDYCFSNAVLAHVPKEDFAQLAAELHRVMKPDGVSVHRVDLRDCIAGSLNNLRFSEATWEGGLFRNSGFYTNRIRFAEMVAMFGKAGFDCQLPRILRWDALPIPRAKLDKTFRDLPEDDLLIMGFDAVLRRKR